MPSGLDSLGTDEFRVAELPLLKTKTTPVLKPYPEHWRVQTTEDLSAIL